MSSLLAEDLRFFRAESYLNMDDDHWMWKYFFSSITSCHSSLLTSSLKCSFRQSIDFREISEHSLSVWVKSFPAVTF